MQQLFVDVQTLEGLFSRLDLGQDDPESGDLMSGNSKGVMSGKDFISVHQIHYDKAVMGSAQMRFGRNPVQECMGHYCAKERSCMAAEICDSVCVKQSEGVCRR